MIINSSSRPFFLHLASFTILHILIEKVLICCKDKNWKGHHFEMRLHQNKRAQKYLVKKELSCSPLCAQYLWSHFVCIKADFCGVRLLNCLRLSLWCTLPQPGSTRHNPATYLILLHTSFVPIHIFLRGLPNHHICRPIEEVKFKVK